MFCEDGMMRRRARIVNRGFETLERRCCLAGNVTAALVGGDLVITGDAEANVISVVETEIDGEFVILAESDAGGVSTSLNGTGNGAAVIAGVTRNIVIYMHGGADVVAVADIDHVGNLTIDAGSGDDSLSAAQVSLGADLTIHVGDDQNVVTLTAIDTGGSLLVDSGTSATRQIPNVYLLTDSRIGVDAQFDLGARAGSVAINGVSIGHHLQVDNSEVLPSFPWAHLGFQETYAAIRFDDLIVGEQLYIHSSANTLVTADNVFSGNGFFIKGYASYNAFEIHNSRSVGKMSVSTTSVGPLMGFGYAESAYDRVDVSGIIVDGEFDTNTGGDLRIAYSNFLAAAKVIMTSSADTLVVDTSLFRANASLIIDPGNDALEFKNSIVNGTLAVAHRRGVGNLPNDSAHRGSFDGSSVFSFTSNRLGALQVYTGDATDEIRIAYCIIDQLFANLDIQGSGATNGGSDLLEIVGTVANQWAHLDGSGGFDVFRSIGNTLNGVVVLGFEAVGV